MHGVFDWKGNSEISIRSMQKEFFFIRGRFIFGKSFCSTYAWHLFFYTFYETLLLLRLETTCTDCLPILTILSYVSSALRFRHTKMACLRGAIRETREGLHMRVYRVHYGKWEPERRLSQDQLQVSHKVLPVKVQ